MLWSPSVAGRLTDSERTFELFLRFASADERRVNVRGRANGRCVDGGRARPIRRAAGRRPRSTSATTRGTSSATRTCASGRGPQFPARQRLLTGQRVGRQSAPNPNFRAKPAPRPSRGGYVWVYVLKGGRSGWVDADVLAHDAGGWADGPDSVDFEVGSAPGVRARARSAGARAACGWAGASPGAARSAPRRRTCATRRTRRRSSTSCAATSSSAAGAIRAATSA